MQIALWKTPETTLARALVAHSYLWVVYFIFGVLGLEHLSNFFRRRFEKKKLKQDFSPITFVFFALEEEASFFQRVVADRPDVIVLLTGIGKKNAETVSRERILKCSPKLVLTCGFAGALNEELNLGDVIFTTEDEILCNKLMAIGVKPAKFCCSERIATTVREKAGLRQKSGADAVEMESDAIQSICRERGIPCATVRVISDTAGEDLPLDFNQLSKPDMNLDYGKLAWAIAKSPGKIVGLLRLQKRCRFAAENLAEILAKAIFR